MPFEIRNFRGERIHLEFRFNDELSRRRAKKLAREAERPFCAGLIGGALLASLAIKLSANSIFFDAVVLWP